MALDTTKRFADGELPVESGRFRLVATGSCPDCRRVLIARRVLGLTEVIPVTWSYGHGADGSWELTGDDGDAGFNSALNARSLKEIYERTPGFSGAATVPALVDTATGQVVNDNVDEMLQDLAVAWKPLHGKHATNLYPKESAAAVQAWNKWVDEEVDAHHQAIMKATPGEEKWDDAAHILIAFDVVDTLLARATGMEAAREAALTVFDGPQLAAVTTVGQFLCGETPTLADIRLFTTLQDYVYGGRHKYPDNDSPSLTFWPALSRWFRALESRVNWVGPEERAALGI